MKIEELKGKNTCIIGFGREGQAMAKALEEFASGCIITIADQNSNLKTTNYKLKTGQDYLKGLDKFDVVIKSPGIFPNPELEKVKSKITTSTQIFLDSIADSGATVIGVTGSKGKSTTSSLIYSILKAAGKNAYLIGNIGEPAIAHLNDAKPNTFFVQEMSSYQLMDLTVSPQISVVTSFFPEHLDYHRSLENYHEAKKHIARFQKKSDVIIFNDANEGSRAIAKESKGKHIPFTEKDAPVKVGDTKLKGKHNLSNIAAAWKTTEFLGVPKNIAIEAIKDFTPLPHRLQSLGIIDGIEWVNDSISTTPESAIAAIDALGAKVKTIILGGQDRGYDFSPLARKIASSNVDFVIMLPDSGKTISIEVKKTQWGGRMEEAETLQQAVEFAKKHSPAHSIVLLSPASPSYGQFKNFEERGKAFRASVMGA